MGVVRVVRVEASVVDAFWEFRSSGMSYPCAAESAGMAVTTGYRLLLAAGGIRPRHPRLGSGRFLSFVEREEIAVGLAAGLTAAAIARRLGRHRSTICREIARNQRDVVPRRRPRYRASVAQHRAGQRARRPKAAKLAQRGELHDRVQTMLRLRWSPRQIAIKLRREFPDRPEMWVSHETIYQSLYVQSRGALRRELTACLRTGRAVRRPKRRADERRGRLKDMIMISERPAEVADRSVPGHWEGDLILGANNASAIGTLVERATRYVMLLHLPQGYRPEQVQQAMVAQMSGLPRHLRASLTWDQGKEMARHAQIRVELDDMPIYFCDPHSPWQRGSNENTNGLLRQYFPKGTDLSVHSAEDLEFVAAQLNGRPRQTLNWHTPAERLNELLLQ
jgi:IS30 family transposase